MKRKFVVLGFFGLMFLLSACSGSKPTGLDVAKAFVDGGLPVANVTVYTAEIDPNELLGRPHQYIEKIVFTDNRIYSGGEINMDAGGTIEVFENKEDMQKRKDYVETITSSASVFAEYAYSNDYMLLRLAKSLTPDQAGEYEKIFMDIK